MNALNQFGPGVGEDMFENEDLDDDEDDYDYPEDFDDMDDGFHDD